MSDIIAPIGHNGGPPLEDVYDEYIPRRAPTARSKRAKQNLAKRTGLDRLFIRLGNTTLIDPVAADEYLKTRAGRKPGQFDQPERRGRGRPRTINVIS